VINLEEKNRNAECKYEADKPNRDKVRETLWNKIVNVDRRVETLNEYMTAQLEATEEHNEAQDRRHDELKALVQETSATLMETERKIENLSANLNNGWKTSFMTDLTNKLFHMLEATGGQVYKIRTQQEDLKAKQEEFKKIKIEKNRAVFMEIIKVVGTILGTGGIVMVLIGRL